MTFPVYESKAVTTGSGWNTTPQIITMPDGSVAGNLLFAFVAHDTSGSVTQSGGSDWTRIDNGATGTYVKSCIFAKVAAGGDSLTITDDDDDNNIVTAIRVSGHSVSDVSVDIILGIAATGNSSNPDPPNCNPGTADDYLWIEHVAADHPSSGEYWPSTNYTTIDSTYTFNQVGILVARRNLNAAAEDPGTVDINEAERWRAQTLAIPPSSIVPTPGVMMSAG